MPTGFCRQQSQSDRAAARLGLSAGPFKARTGVPNNKGFVAQQRLNPTIAARRIARLGAFAARAGLNSYGRYMYKPGAVSCAHNQPSIPGYDGVEWSWKNCSDAYLSEEGVEGWKPAFYDVERWDFKTGYPKRKILEKLGLREVSDILQDRHKLGA